MNSAVIVFPGSNCDRDAAVALETVFGRAPSMVWHKDAQLPSGLDLVVVPGGFSYGDYLRCGAIAGNSPIIPELRTHAERGGLILGICNGFQVLTETGLLPGALVRNNSLNFVCRNQTLTVESCDSPFVAGYSADERIVVPVAHHDGNYIADEETLNRLEADNRVAFRYVGNPNGSTNDIAGIVSKNGRVLGMMPHPERAIGHHEGGADGSRLFGGLLESAFAN